MAIGPGYSLVVLKLISGDTWIQLTASTLSFTKMFLTLLEDCMRLKTTELIYTIDETLYSVFEAQIKHMENSLRNELNQDVNIPKISFLFYKRCFKLCARLNFSIKHRLLKNCKHFYFDIKYTYSANTLLLFQRNC